MGFRPSRLCTGAWIFSVSASIWAVCSALVFPLCQMKSIDGLILEKTRLIELTPRRGARVTEMSQVDIESLYDVLTELYTLVARKAAENREQEDLQKIDRTLFRAKGFDTFAPIGPYIVTTDEIPDPHSLDIKLWQNGELRQSDNTREMIFKIPHLISYISKVTTLFPGDIIATGTPAGVGPVKHGDKLVAKIDRIGTLEVLIED